MKTKQNFVRWGLVALLGAMLITFTQCIGGSTSSVDDSVSAQPNEVLIPEDEEAPEIGVKDAERTLMTMSAVTGVPASTVRNIFNSDLKAQLPTNARVEAMLETHMMGATKLASEFCNALVNDGTRRAAIWPTFNFAENNANQFLAGSASRRMFIIQMLEAFWGVGTLEEAEYEEGAAAIDQLITDMLTQVVDPVSGNTIAAPGNTNAAKLNAAKAACTAALSSAQVILQ
jgi:hypothetical protein